MEQDSKIVPLRELKVSDDEVREWSQEAATRLWFRALHSLYTDIQLKASTAYEHGDIGKTYGLMAQYQGQLLLLNRLMNAEIGDTLIFLEQDREEIENG
jgi:hypothetical protein